MYYEQEVPGIKSHRIISNCLKGFGIFCLGIFLTTALQPIAGAQQKDRNPTRAPDQQQQAELEQGNTRDGGRVVVTTDLVSVKVSVTNAEGLAVFGLDKSAFTVFDDKVPQNISFFADDDAPTSIAVIFDTSGSMSQRKMAQAKEALARFLQTTDARDEYFLIDFNSQARLLLDGTRDADTLFGKLTYVQPRGNTALYDAVYLGMERVARGAYQKRAVLLISDGEDNDSRHTFNQLRQRLKESDVIIYAIGTAANFLPRKGALNGRETLDELALASGGKAYFPTSAVDMSEVFEQIALELRHQYSLGYRPTDFTPNGKWHQLKVKVSTSRGSPRVFVRNRPGYYAVESSGSREGNSF